MPFVCVIFLRLLCVRLGGTMHGISVRGDVGVGNTARSCFHHSSKVATVIAAGTGVVLHVTIGTWSRAAWSQEAQRATITITFPPVTRAQPASVTQLSIHVGAQETLPKNSFIRIRGLPAVVAVSSGYAVAPGAWFVPLIAVPNLTIVVPSGVQEKSEVAIDLVKDDGSVLAQARTLLMVAPAAPAHAHQQHVVAAAASKRDLDPSPLAAIEKGFDAFLAKRGLTTDQKKTGSKAALNADQKAEMFRLFLTWPQNPLEVDVVVRLTSESGVGDPIGTFAVKNSEVLVVAEKSLLCY